MEGLIPARSLTKGQAYLTLSQAEPGSSLISQFFHQPRHEPEIVNCRQSEEQTIVDLKQVMEIS